MTGDRSEFGRGYATCLRQFANHRARLDEFLVMHIWLGESEAVEMWASGASDHLYDLIVATAGISDDERQRAVRLQKRGLDIGRGFRPSSRSDGAEALRLLDEAEALLGLLEVPTGDLDAAMDADRALGLEPDAGWFSCPLDLRRHVAVGKSL